LSNKIDGRHNFNIEINGLKFGVIVDKSGYKGMYKMASKPFQSETINPALDLPYAFYALTHNRRIQRQFFKGESVRL